MPVDRQVPTTFYSSHKVLFFFCFFFIGIFCFLLSFCLDHSHTKWPSLLHLCFVLVNTLIKLKLRLSFLFWSIQTDALKCVAQASKNRSLADFEKVRSPFFCLITLIWMDVHVEEAHFLLALLVVFLFSYCSSCLLADVQHTQKWTICPLNFSLKDYIWWEHDAQNRVPSVAQCTLPLPCLKKFLSQIASSDLSQTFASFRP